MAPLNPNNTARFRFHYTTIGKQHTMEIRSTSSPAAVGTFMMTFLNALSGVQYASVIDFVDWAAAGSNVFNPVVTGAEGFVWGSGAGLITNVPLFVNFIGRTAGGRRVRLAVFGNAVGAVDYRFLNTENGTVDNARAALVAAGSLILGIDGLVPIWKSYANQGYNAYWQRQVRP